MSAILELVALGLQSLLAIAFGCVLLGLNRHYRRGYLAHWALASLALAVYLVMSTVARAIAMSGSPSGVARTVASSIALSAGYAHLVWLLAGGWEVWAGRALARNRSRLLLSLSVLVAVTLVVATAGPWSTPYGRIIMRYGVRALVAGLAFLMVAWLLYRAKFARGPARAVLLTGLVSYGLIHLQQFAMLSHLMPSPPWTAALGFLEVMVIAATGFGLVFSMLDEERARAVRASERIEHLAYFDSVTGRPNRRHFVDRLTQALALARRSERPLAVLFINLDQFKVVNDSLGHARADGLLREVAELLERHSRKGDTVARVGGDEFGLVLTDLKHSDDAVHIARTILAEVRRPFRGSGQDVYTSSSIGLSVFPDDGSDAGALMRGADIALRNAKQNGRDRLVHFSPEMNARAAEQLAIEGTLRRALANNEFVLHYQPVVDLASGAVWRFEALVRWQHPERGCLLPGEFLPVVERIGLSEALDFWVLRAACLQAKAWRATGWHDVRLSVNISTRPFQTPDLVDRITEVLRETDMDPRRLELEITETMAMLNPEASRAAMIGLRELGVRIAIDDFGTGYSSLSYLRSLPVDCLKIDRSFVHDLASDGDAAAVATAIISLAHSLRMGVVAEGVETEEQRAMLERNGCDLMQGFLVSPPVPAEACERLMALGQVTS